MTALTSRSVGSVSLATGKERGGLVLRGSVVVLSAKVCAKVGMSLRMVLGSGDVSRTAPCCRILELGRGGSRLGEFRPSGELFSGDNDRARSVVKHGLVT